MLIIETSLTKAFIEVRLGIVDMIVLIFTTSTLQMFINNVEFLADAINPRPLTGDHIFGTRVTSSLKMKSSERSFPVSLSFCFYVIVIVSV